MAKPSTGEILLPTAQYFQWCTISGIGAGLQRRGGVARHDGVAWGFARAASTRGVHIIENCAVTGINRVPDGSVTGVETTRGTIGAKKVALSVAAGSSLLLNMAGISAPIECFTLQALVSEPIEPVFPCVALSNSVHAYVSQSDKGELVIGAGTEQYNSYSQRGRCTPLSTQWPPFVRCFRFLPGYACCVIGEARLM